MSRFEDVAAQPRTPIRIVQILENLAEVRGPISLAELARRLQAPKTSIFALLRALEVGGYVTRTGETYTLGAASLRLGIMLEGASSFLQVTRPVLEKLAEQTGETVILAVLDRERVEALYVDEVAAIHSVRFVSTRGMRRPLYCTAAGKAMLAFQDADFIDRYLATVPLDKHADKTRTGKAALLKDLDAIRRAGYARTYKEMQNEVKGWSAPVTDADGKVSASITVAMPADRKEVVSELGPLLIAAAQAASGVKR